MQKNYRPSVSILKSKKAVRDPLAVVLDYVKVLTKILEANKHVTLATDLFYVNQVPLFATVSDHIKFITADHILSRNSVQIVKAATNVNNIYHTCGFHFHTTLMERNVSPLKG